jgi:hypothetical protein
MQGLVQTERVADARKRNARGAAEVRGHWTHELLQFGVVDHFPKPLVTRLTT